MSLFIFLAEVRIFGFNFAPTGWAFCNGQLIPISQNTALFSLVGTFYGGDGKSTFALPNLQGSAAMSPGQGPGLSAHFLGEQSGSETVTLLQSEMPIHTHNILASPQPSGVSAPANDRMLSRGFGGSPFKQQPFTNQVSMAAQQVGIAGGDFPHNNMMPYLTLNYCIALQGVFPARN